MAQGMAHAMSSYRLWAATSTASSIVLVRLLPQYSIRQSYLLTALAIFCLQWFVYGIYAVIIYPKLLSPMRHLPMPKGGTFFNGHWAEIIKDPSGIPMRRWFNEVPNDGLIRYLHIFNRERVMVTNPKTLAEVLTTKSYDFVKPELLRVGLGQILGNGILFVEGDEHKVQRKNLMPAFNFRHVKELYPIFWGKSQEMVYYVEAELKEKAPNNSIDMAEWASRATLDIIGTAGLGQDFNALKDPTTELNMIYRKIFQPSRSAIIIGMLQPFIPAPILHNLPLQRNNDIHVASRVARETSRRLVKQKKERMERKEKLHPDIISIALESGGFTDEELVDNMMTFLAAGHETTATVFTWAVYLLSKNTDIQNRLRGEIHAHISGISDSMDSTKLDKLLFLHAVCNEVLRMWSPVPLTFRDAGRDTTINGQLITRGTKVVLCSWAVNYDKATWGPDADEFRPDRWMAPGCANTGGATSNYAFLTFLHGPRSCIGQRFAVAEFAALLAAFVGSFEFVMTDPDEKIDIKGGITARPKNGMKLDLKVVEGWE